MSDSVEKRRLEAKRIHDKYPDRVPVICSRALNAKSLPEIEKKKFLVPGTMLCGEFKYIISRHIAQANSGGKANSICSNSDSNSNANAATGANETIYLYVHNITPKVAALMSEIHDQYKDKDGFLYMVYSAENTLGAALRE